MNTATEPVAPDFKLRHLGNVAYAMSVGTGAVGQILFLGGEFGGEEATSTIGPYVAASGLAAFAEFVMVSAGDKSLHHRAHGRSWVPMLLVGVLVAVYAGGMNVAHFWATNKALAFTFGGASVIGFLQHIIDGHIKVKAFLDAQAAFVAAQVVAPKPSRSARTPAVAREAAAPAASTSPAVDAAPAAAVPAPLNTGTAAATPTSNVREIHPGQPTLKEKGRAWFFAQVEQGRDPGSISAADIDRAIGATVGYCKKHIGKWHAEVAARNAANQ